MIELGIASVAEGAAKIIPLEVNASSVAVGPAIPSKLCIVGAKVGISRGKQHWPEDSEAAVAVAVLTALIRLTSGKGKGR